VERVVPVVAKKNRRGKAITPEVAAQLDKGIES
jgi:hypothetical protein